MDIKELEEGNRRQAKLLKKMAAQVTDALDIMVDVEASFKRDEELKKRISEFIYGKKK